MALLTTTIGSYPKPDYLHIPPFVPKHPDPTRRYSEYLASRTAQDDALLDRATRENVRHQIEAGIDIPTDGEILLRGAGGAGGRGGPAGHAG